MYRLLAVDVDGTLLDSSHVLRPRVRAAVRALGRRGVHVALATGKLLRSATELVQSLNLTGPQITCNGAVIRDARGGELLAFWPLEDVEFALEALREADPDLGIAWYSPDAIFTDHKGGDLDAILSAYHEPPLIRVARLDRRLPAPAKLLVTGSPERLAATRARVAPRLDGRVQVITTTADFLEFLSPLATKGNALRAIMRELDIAPDAVVAVGDGENDCSLLAAAGCAVAMGNAVAALCALATCRTASNDEDGVALVVEAMLAGSPIGFPLAANARAPARAIEDGHLSAP